MPPLHDWHRMWIRAVLAIVSAVTGIASLVVWLTHGSLGWLITLTVISIAAGVAEWGLRS